MEISLESVILVVIGAVVVAVLLRYGKMIVRLLSALGGLVALVILAAVVALVFGWWEPSLPTLLDVLKAVVAQ